MSETASPVDIRAELAFMLASELIGPKAGPEEQVLFGTVRERYLGGMLAPRSTVGVSAERSDDPGHLDGDDAVEDPESSAAAARPALFPSSFGFSCVVDGAVDKLLVSGAWGRYERIDVEGEGPDGKSRRAWQRVPVEDSIEVALVEGPIVPAAFAPTEHPGVELMGQVTRQGGASLVSLFLVNAQESDKRDSSWLFQAGLSVTASGSDASVFVGRTHVLSADDVGVQSSEPELAELDLLYRNRVEFAVGHGVAVHVDVDPTDPKRAYRIVTQSLPLTEVPRTEAPTADEDPVLGLAEFDMARLAVLSQPELVASVQPIVDAYLKWLGEQRERHVAGVDGLADHAIAAELNLMRAEEIAGRIQSGVDLLGSDPDAAEAFRFANEAMWQQRVRTTAIEVARGSQRPVGELLVEADMVRNRSWRPFQLAFVLVNLPSLTIPTHPERSADDALVDLLFFPTGGGKTEAYLGLTAYTLAIRRLQGIVEGHDGSGGVAVLMRYTLRLLTAQQFQRAAALICACEVIRRAKVQADPRWGATPYRIGLWVGSALTPNRSKDAQQALEEQREGKRVKGSQPIQITGCPWCGRAIGAGSDAHFDVDTWRTLIFCPDQFGTCPFTEIASGREGIPVVTVDEDLYRLLPDLVIATADKFAQLPLQGPLHMLFGRVSRKCTRHGYRSPDLDRYTDREERDSHKATRLHGPASTVACLPLRPPDLIIQDELHLISGPLGTLVGLYETAVDDLASWTVNGQRVRPKVVASTATIRRAKEQTEALFWRGLAIASSIALDAAWPAIEDPEAPISEEGELKFAVARDPRLAKLKGFNVSDLWAAIVERRTGSAVTPEDADVLRPEWAVFTGTGKYIDSHDFRLGTPRPIPGFLGLGTVLAVDRIREVVALCGFTRIEGPDSGLASDIETGPVYAPISKAKKLEWLPAAEVRGEGIFLRFPETTIDAWLDVVSGSNQIESLREAHHRWRRSRGQTDLNAGWPGARYVLIHSLSHALIRELALECGYSTASIRERIYAREQITSAEAMAGVFLYTAAPDSEGTLGGLVALADPTEFGRLLGSAMERSRLCSSDPMCSGHLPNENETALHNAACHACLFLPETSCERANRYLDRNVLVSTLAGAGVHYPSRG